MTDSDFVQTMMNMPASHMATFFYRNSHLLLDDANYWNLLGTLWKLGGTVIQQDLWLELFNSKRKKRHKIMKSRERRAFRRLPKTLTAYRAVNALSEADTAISWTLLECIAQKIFSKNGTREVVKRIFDKSQVFAFFDRRGESEILVFRDHSMGQGIR